MALEGDPAVADFHRVGYVPVDAGFAISAALSVLAHFSLLGLFQLASPPLPCLELDTTQLHELHATIPPCIEPPPWTQGLRPRSAQDGGPSEIDFIDREIRGARVQPAGDEQLRLRGALPRMLVLRWLRAQSNQVLHCYQRALERRPSLEGRVVVRFAIGKTGSVEGAAQVESELHDPGLERCITATVGRWYFYRPDDGLVATVAYPYELLRRAK